MGEAEEHRQNHQKGGGFRPDGLSSLSTTVKPQAEEESWSGLAPRSRFQDKRLGNFCSLPFSAQWVVINDRAGLSVGNILFLAATLDL